ncbi:hypothetical protein [Gandjariella thermophila]|uniref:DUF1345 domain-containing protein n=1 Tax=Gandjariella thermophila TaxID=1931992 RepID=A0A4D4J7G4_9PSEU|nr:hypothetical protein [Gandjariella thermophila]GDY30449.1 hypothetical protein GTS_20820 [Gandjariella thermophila]
MEQNGWEAGTEMPAWRRRTRGEHRWPVALAIVVAVALQLPLPDRVVFGPRWLLPGLSLLLVVVLMAMNPGRIGRRGGPERLLGLGVVTVLSIGNGLSGALLVHRLLTGTAGQDAGTLLVTGAAIYLTNIIAFSLWYWEWDRGGPAARAAGVRQDADFLFPQMTTPEVAPPDWEPSYVDYLYLSFTNATAFSPTDVMPLRPWAKLTMLLQSAVSLAIVVLVVARAVNILR